MLKGNARRKLDESDIGYMGLSNHSYVFSDAESAEVFLMHLESYRKLRILHKGLAFSVSGNSPVPWMQIRNVFRCKNQLEAAERLLIKELTGAAGLNGL